MARPYRQRIALRWCWLVLVVILVGGCATGQFGRLDDLTAVDAKPLPVRVELTEVAFFPQRRYQCGPAALATVLLPFDPEVTADALVDEVYLPARQGSLQIELLAATRARGLIPVELDGALHAAFAELAGGRPVLVFQNLGFAWRPYWHFAVLIGYDLERSTAILRSGAHKRREIPLRVFDRTWARTGRWAFVVAPPDAPPVSADPLSWTRAAVALNAAGHDAAALTAHKAATRRWDDSALAWIALGNARHAGGDTDGALAATLRSIAVEPEAHAGWNNAAFLLGERQCRREAQRAINCAINLAPTHATYRSTYATVFGETTADGIACPPLPVCPIAGPGWPQAAPRDKR